MEKVDNIQKQIESVNKQMQKLGNTVKSRTEHPRIVDNNKGMHNENIRRRKREMNRSNKWGNND